MPYRYHPNGWTGTHHHMRTHTHTHRQRNGHGRHQLARRSHATDGLTAPKLLPISTVRLKCRRTMSNQDGIGLTHLHFTRSKSAHAPTINFIAPEPQCRLLTLLLLAATHESHPELRLLSSMTAPARPSRCRPHLLQAGSRRAWSIC